MKLARRALDDPERITELKQQLDAQLAELLAEATDAGYSTREVIEALSGLCSRQHRLLSEDPGPPDDPGTTTLGWWLSFLFMLLLVAFAYAVIVTLVGE